MPYPNGDILYESLQQVAKNECPFSMGTLSHELTHMIFDSTILQRGYDAGGTLLPNQTYVDSLDLSEGLATYMPYYLTKDYDGFDNKDAYHNSLCGKNSLLDTYGYWSEATPEQLKYKSALIGQGYDANHYEAGYCFFHRVEEDCGIEAIDYMFQKVIEKKGTLDTQPTIFKHLTDKCEETTVQEIMQDFGFDESLLNLYHTYPVGEFLSGDQGPGCI